MSHCRCELIYQPGTWTVATRAHANKSHMQKHLSTSKEEVIHAFFASSNCTERVSVLREMEEFRSFSGCLLASNSITTYCGKRAQISFCVCLDLLERCIVCSHKKELIKCIMFPSVSHRKTNSCMVCLLCGGQEVPKLDKAKTTQSSITIEKCPGTYSYLCFH